MITFFYWWVSFSQLLFLDETTQLRSCYDITCKRIFIKTSFILRNWLTHNVEILNYYKPIILSNYTVKTHLKWHATIPGTWFIVAMPQHNGTDSLTLLVLHAILSISGPIRSCHYTRDNPLVTYSGMSKPNTFPHMIRLERHAQTMWYAQTMWHAWVRL